MIGLQFRRTMRLALVFSSFYTMMMRIRSEELSGEGLLFIRKSVMCREQQDDLSYDQDI